ncbi:hypothetical protein Droror1_Dr00021947 [Drosera rotundifolia]
MMIVMARRVDDDELVVQLVVAAVMRLWLMMRGGGYDVGEVVIGATRRSKSQGYDVDEGKPRPLREKK